MIKANEKLQFFFILIFAVVTNIILIKYDVSLVPDFVNNYWANVIGENVFIFQIVTVSMLIFLMLLGIDALKKNKK